MPKIIVYGEKYKKMSDSGKLFYMICLDLIKLSMKKGWKDEQGRYYIKMSLDTIKDRMNCQNTKAVNLKKELIAFDLMKIKRLGQGKADRLYILQAEFTEADIYKANNDHEDIGNDEETISENTGALETQENSENQSSKNPKIGEQEICKSETIKNLSIKTNSINSFDDDKRRTSPSGEDSATLNNNSINLLISNFRESTKDELTDRSFNSVVRKVMDKYEQGKVNSFRDYLVTALVKKIEELELRRAKDKAKEQLKATGRERILQRKQQLDEQPIKELPFYDWLNA